MAASDLAKKWTRKNPYVYIDRKYPRRMVIFWEKGRTVEHTYARWLYEKEVGPIPEGQTIHHINHDKMDDRVDNFRLYTHSQHAKYHSRARAKA